MFRKKIKVGFTLVEAMISTTVMVFFIALVTNLLIVFNNNNNAQNIRETMDMDLRKAIERLERELTGARNILDSFTMFAGTADEFTITSQANQLVLSVPAYDGNNNPLILPSGELLCDVMAIRMSDNPKITVRRTNPVTNKVEILPVKKLEFSIDPAEGSRRQKIVKQSIFQYYIPISSDGQYQTPSDGTFLNMADGSIPKLFSFYTDREYVSSSCIYPKDQANSVVEINPTCGQIIFTRTLKIVLLAEKNWGSQFFTGKRETEIRLRNSTN